MTLDSLTPVGEITFNHYDQMIQAAIDGQGVALGRISRLAELIRQGKLVSPFDRPRCPKDWRAPSRSFYAIVEEGSSQRPEEQRFVDWLTAEAGKDSA